VSRRWWLVLAWLLALALGSAAAQSPPGELAIDAGDRYALSNSFTYLEDKQGRLTFGDILEPRAQAAFKTVPITGPGLNFGLTASAIWLRVKLRVSQQAPANWLLELAYPPLDEIELFMRGEAGGFEHRLAGDLQPFSTRPVPHRNHVLPVRLAPGEETMIYLRLKSEGVVAAPAVLSQPAALARRDQASYARYGLYFGLLIGLLVYNLLLFVSVRDTGYLFYAGFVASMGIGLAGLTGLGAQFLWPRWTWWNNVSPAAGLGACAIFAVLFARNFLSTPLRMRQVDRFMMAQLAGWVLTVAAALTLPLRFSIWMVTVLAFISVITLVVVGVISIRREFAGARFFALAWAVLLLGALGLALHNLGLLPSNAITANALLIGSALEMVLLSFALADRINVSRRFKEQAQARIAAEHAMVQALSQSQDHLRMILQERELILEGSIVGIAFLTPGGRFKWANKAMLDIFGTKVRANASMEPFYLSREQYLRVGGEVSECVSRGAVFESELQMRRADGTPIWVSLSGKAVSRRDLSQGTVWVVMNITERKRLEEQLQKTGSEREAILNSLLVGIVLGVGRRHAWVNEKFAQMVGYPREELIGQSTSHIHPDQETWERLGVETHAALRETGMFVGERQLKRRNGELFWVEMSGSCVRPNDPESGVIWTLLDITARKESEIEIRQALEQQKTLNELRSRFVAMSSHELRTPLAGIRSAEELLRHYGDRLPEAERVEILDSIAVGVQRMARMMDRVLLLGKSEAGMLDFRPQPVEIAPLCRDFVEEALAQHPGQGSQLALEVGEDVGQGVYDEKLLRHIFSNLLSNALKYSPEGGPVRFEVRRDGPSTVFKVVDRGIGIPPDEIPRLFKSFHRASNVGAIQGTGLGLAIVKNAVDMHGGDIGVESTPGQGTTFTVTLPARVNAG
jgi:PAS domain S-box-containing protein